MIYLRWVDNHYGSGLVLRNSKVNVTLLWRFQDWYSEEHLFLSRSLGRSYAFPNRTIHVASTLGCMRRRLPLNSLWNWNAITYWEQALNITEKAKELSCFFFLCIWGVFARRINYPEHTIILNSNAQIRQLVEYFSGFFQKLIVALKHWSFLVFISNCKDAKEINKRSKSLKLYRMKYHNTCPKNIEWNTIIHEYRMK